MRSTPPTIRSMSVIAKPMSSQSRLPPLNSRFASRSPKTWTATKPGQDDDQVRPEGERAQDRHLGRPGPVLGGQGHDHDGEDAADAGSSPRGCVRTGGRRCASAGFQTIRTRIAIRRTKRAHVHRERARVADGEAELLARPVTVLRKLLGELADVPHPRPGRPGRAPRSAPRGRSRRSPSPRRARSRRTRRARSRARARRATRLRRRRPRGAMSRSSSATSLGTLAPHRRQREHPGDDRAGDEEEGAEDVDEQQPVVLRHGASSLERPPAYNRPDGRHRAASSPADGDDRRRQLDARPPGGARARREQGGGGARAPTRASSTSTTSGRTSSCCGRRTGRASRR